MKYVSSLNFYKVETNPIFFKGKIKCIEENSFFESSISALAHCDVWFDPILVPSLYHKIFALRLMTKIHLGCWASWRNCYWSRSRACMLRWFRWQGGRIRFRHRVNWGCWPSWKCGAHWQVGFIWSCFSSWYHRLWSVFRWWVKFL